MTTRFIKSFKAHRLGLSIGFGALTLGSLMMASLMKAEDLLSQQTMKDSKLYKGAVIVTVGTCIMGGAIALNQTISTIAGAVLPKWWLKHTTVFSKKMLEKIFS